MSNREKLHKMLDLVLDIADKGIGVDGYPFVGFDVTNYPQGLLFSCKEKGFDDDSNRSYDVFELTSFNGDKIDEYIKYLECISEKANKIREDGEKDVCRN